MKRTYLPLLAAVALFPAQIHAHQQHVHQYIVKEAYQLLRQTYGYDFPRMTDHVGDLTPFYAGDSAWQRPYLTTGAWREDVEDVVFNYSSIWVPGIGNNYALTSITHFWDADDGDLEGNRFTLLCPPPPLPSVYIQSYENAYDKLMRYALGDGNPGRHWVIRYPRVFLARHATNNHVLIVTPLPALPFGVPVSYDTLTRFVHTRKLNFPTPSSPAYSIFDVNEGRTLNNSDVPQVVVSDDFVDSIVWEVLGRMCHLLGDMSIPAHTHRDEHGLQADSYENWIASPTAYQVWNGQNSGPLIRPDTTDAAPLHYLMYTMQQQCDHFGSNGPCDGDGNNIVGGSPRPLEAQLITPAYLASLGEPTTSGGPWTEANLENIRDRTFPYVIRATAGLLLWFAHEALGIPVAVAVTPSAPAGFVLCQNYPNPFNPTTTITFSVGRRERLSLKVFDVLGREVATLADEVGGPGTYAVLWNAAGLASGVYFYQLRAGSVVVDTKRLVLMK